MAVQIQFRHVEGMRIRQQTFRDIPHTVPAKLKRAPDPNFPDDPSRSIEVLLEPERIENVREWKFEPEDIPQDEDARTHKPTGVYTVHLAYNLKNVVLERKGPGENVTFRNAGIRNTLRIWQQTFTDTGKLSKGGKAIKDWVKQSPSLLAPNTYGGVFIGDGNRAIVEELPT